jgi:hypothetical protein
MNTAVVAALTRHILTAVGGGFFAAWGLDGETVNVVVGAVATLVSVTWSVWDKKH